jgi:hypothetical protein
VRTCRARAAPLLRSPPRPPLRFEALLTLPSVVGPPVHDEPQKSALGSRPCLSAQREDATTMQAIAYPFGGWWGMLAFASQCALGSHFKAVQKSTKPVVFITGDQCVPCEHRCSQRASRACRSTLNK